MAGFFRFYKDYLSPRPSLGIGGLVCILTFLLAIGAGTWGLILLVIILPLCLLARSELTYALTGLVICLLVLNGFLSKVSVYDENISIAEEVHDKNIEVRGEVFRVVGNKSRNSIYVHLAELKLINQEVVSFTPERFDILINTFEDTVLETGDSVSVKFTAHVPENFNDFDYREYLQRKGIFLVAESVSSIQILSEGSNKISVYLETLRAGILRSFHSSLSPSLAGVLFGMIFGVKEVVPREILTRFNDAGVSHILVASGYNVVLVMIWCEKLFMFLGRRFTTWLSSFGILLLLLFIGVDNMPILRASLFGVILIISKSLGHKRVPIHALIYVIAGMTSLDAWLWLDISFQLSIASTFGLLAAQKYIHHFGEAFQGQGVYRFISKIELMPTLIAILATFPIVIVNFKDFPLLAIVANCFILPLVPVIIFVGVMHLLLSLLSLKPVLIFTGLFLTGLLKFSVFIASMTAGSPLNNIEFGVDNRFYLLYAAILVFLLYDFYRTKPK